MNQWQRLLFYIVLNVIVSACTTLAVLWFWDRTRETAPVFGQDPQATLPSGLVDSPASSALTPVAVEETPSDPITPIPAGELPVLVTVDNVFGVGNLTDEVVVLKRAGDGELDLTNWKLADAEGNSYVFPALTLYKDGAVQVHTAAGVNTVVDLYWGNAAPVWQAGELVSLFDAQGNVRATYRLP